MLLEDNGLYRFSADGIGQGARVIRRHRLWEVYLTRFLELPIDHVHRDAEQMEHILTPDMEKRLEELLGRPEFDPHQQEIPYVEKEAGR
jgi:manganese/zinc/iron transport system permease protein